MGKVVSMHLSKVRSVQAAARCICAVTLILLLVGLPTIASETDWAIIIKAGSGGNWYGPMDSGSQTNAFASTIAGVQDDPAIRDTKDGNPPASSPGSTANSAWYRPQWMKNDGTDSTSWPWAFGSDYRTPLNNAPNLVKIWEDLVVWVNPGYVNGGTPNDPSDDHPDIHLFVTTQVNKLAPSSQIPDGKTVAQPIVYKLVMTQWPAGYDGLKAFLLADPADPNLPRNGSPATAKILLADIVLPAAGTEAVNPITGTGPLAAMQTAGYRFAFYVGPVFAPPETQIISGPDDGTYTGSDVTFGFTGSAEQSPTSALVYAVQLDGGPFGTYSAETTISYTGLAAGPHTFCVRARDEIGNIDPSPACRTFTVDLSPPQVPSVTDDGTVALGLTSLHASWSASDPESGIVEYQYAIGTTPLDSGSGYIVDWKSVETATEATETGLSLQEGLTYYWYVKALNGAGVWSTVGVSDGIEAVTLREHGANGHFYAIVPMPMSWTQAKALAESLVYDGHTGYLAAVTSPEESAWLQDNLSLLNPRELEELWIGAYQDTTAPDYSEPDGGWRWVNGEPWLYTRWDSAGEPNEFEDQNENFVYLNTQRDMVWYDVPDDGAGYVDGLIVEFGDPDTSAPTLPVVVDDGSVTSNPTTLHASWSSSDPESGVMEYQYAIGTSPTDPGSGYLLDWKSAGTATEISESGLMRQPNEVYYWYVRATNYSGLWSDVGVSDGIQFAPGTQWSPSLNGNGHYYQVVVVADGIRWNEADAYAREAGGYLATITSAQEDAFVSGLAAAAPSAWTPWQGVAGANGPWLGGWQPYASQEPDGGWRWVTDEPFVYSHWGQGQPDNLLGAENRLIYWRPGGEGTSILWKDTSSDFDPNGPQEPVSTSYVVEYDPGRTHVYFNGFEDSAGPEWSVQSIDVAPGTTSHGQDGFLGQFTNASATLDVADLPDHALLDVTFDLYILRSWDGNASPPSGPDIWQLALDGIPITRTTFSAFDDPQFAPFNRQAYPGTFPGGNHAGKTGASQTNSLGFTYSGNGYNGILDSVYRLHYVLPHSASALRLVFSAEGLGVTGESWGIDNVDISVVNDATPPNAPVVTDDGTFQTPTDQLHASWLASDPESGIAEYQYAIGTSPTDPGSGYVVAWKSVGTATEATESGLTLAHGQVYYWYVKARNGAGLWSAVGVSDGILVSVPLQDPSTGHYYQMIPGWLSWTSARDAAAARSYMGLQGHLVTIATQAEQDWIVQNLSVLNPASLKLFWLGGYQDTQAPDYSEPAGGWRWITGEVWRADGWKSGEPNNTFYNGDPEGYLVWWDTTGGGWNDFPEYGGLSSPNFHAEGYLVEYDQPDVTAPSTPVVGDDGVLTTNPSQLHASWSASDPESGIVEYRYAIGTSPSDPGSGYTVGWTSVGGDTSVTRTGLSLSIGQRYYVYVKALNGYGLWSGVGASDGIYAVSNVSPSAGAAKIADGAAVALEGVVVTSATGQIPGRVYVESPNLSSGIAVLTAKPLAQGDIIDVAGILTTLGGERALDQVLIQVRGHQEPLKGLVMTLRDCSSKPFFYNAISGYGQRGVTDVGGSRTNTIGLLVTVCGQVLDLDAQFVFINDGSFPGLTGVRVDRGNLPGDIQLGDYITVTGISSMRQSLSVYQMLIRPREPGDCQFQ